MKAGSPARAPASPISPAARMISGNGTSRKKIATNAVAASATMTRLRSARRPMRTTASSTIASTAAFRPKNSAATAGTSPKPGVQPAQHHDRDESGQHEQRPGDHAAPASGAAASRCTSRAARLRSRQQHAVVERVQEPVLADPALLLDQDTVHHGDLPGRPAEAERGDLRPHAHRCAERDAVAGRCRTLPFLRRQRAIHVWRSCLLGHLRFLLRKYRSAESGRGRDLARALNPNRPMVVILCTSTR